jgi:site-specific DNA recombinase
MVKDPDTGKRISRVNPKEQWEYHQHPELRIVPAELFERVAKRLEKTSVPKEDMNSAHRPKRLLSGLLKCSACGAGMASQGKNRDGRVRIKCSGDTESGTCPDPRSYYLDIIENAVLEGLLQELRHPEVLAEYAKTYNEEMGRLQERNIKRRAQIEKELLEVEKGNKKYLKAILDESMPKEVISRELWALDAKKKALDAERDAMPQEQAVVKLHPQTMKRYEDALRDLGEEIGEALECGITDGVEKLRELVHRVIVSPHPEGRPGTAHVRVEGDLNVLLGVPLTQVYYETQDLAGGSLVAGEGLEPPTRGL